MNVDPPFSAKTEAGGQTQAGSEPLVVTPIPGVNQTDLTTCLVGVLLVLGWDGGTDDLLVALPHAEPDLDLTDIRNTLARLGFSSEITPPGPLDPRRLPAIVLPSDGPAILLYRDQTERVMTLNGATGQAEPRSLSAVAEPLMYIGRPGAQDGPDGPWIASLVRRFAPEIPSLLLVSAGITCLGLGVPLFSMAVFDVVLASQSAAALPALVIGALIAALGEWGFRAARQRALARIGERLDLLVLVGVFSRVMALPAALVERAGSAAQISRLRDFAAIRDVLTGAFAIALLDLPSTLLVFLLLLILGGWIALVPFVALAGFAALFFASRGAISRAVRAATYTAQARDALALEALEARRGLVLAGAEERWIARYRDLAARAAMASARSATLSGQVPQLAQTMVSITALLALYLGVAAVLNQAMSLGALIAGMMLVWRVLAPLQAGFTLLSRWEQTRASIRQVDTMMTLEIERKPPGQTRMAAPARGDIVFQRVSLRYLAHAEPVLSGASFSIRHGELVAITGGDGAGKSSLLKLVAGIYRPQAGVVRIAGHDARSYDPAVLRRAMGWVPQSPALLYGTIAQNLRLGHPSASDDELRDAAARAHVLDAILALPEGFETRVGDNATAWLPRSVLQRLALARALVRPAPILLLDEPASGLDDACVAAVNAIIAERRGEVTILMATHRPSHIRMADLVLRVRDGQVEQVTADAPPARAPLTRLPLFSNVSAR